MTDYVRQARERWNQRIPGALRARTFDGTTAFQTHWMDTILALVDMAMEDEGIPGFTRQRVIRAVMYGSPNPADGEARIAFAEREVRRLKVEEPPAVVVDASLLEGLAVKRAGEDE